MSMLQAELYLRQLDDIAGETEALYAFIDFVSPSPVIQVARQKRKLRMNMISMICRISYIITYSILCELCDAYLSIYIYVYMFQEYACVCVFACGCVFLCIEARAYIISRHVTSPQTTPHHTCIASHYDYISTFMPYVTFGHTALYRTTYTTRYYLYYIPTSNFQLHPDTTILFSSSLLQSIGNMIPAKLARLCTQLRVVRDEDQ